MNRALAHVTTTSGSGCVVVVVVGWTVSVPRDALDVVVRSTR